MLFLKRWFFSTAMDPIRNWCFSEEEGVARHLEKCPFNVREPMKKMEKNEAWDKVLEGFKGAMRVKRLINF